MKNLISLFLVLILVTACTSTKKLTYLQNLPKTSEIQYFPFEMPDYKIQYRDILYIDIKALTSDGKIEDLLQGNSGANTSFYMQNESAQFISGFNVDKKGFITLPVVGQINVADKTIDSIKIIVQTKVNKTYNNAYVDVKLLSFRVTILGEVKNPGTYFNYNNYLTVLEAIGRAGGIGDFGKRDRILVIRSTGNGSKTYILNLKDKNILASEAYFLMPNDVVIIEPLSTKTFNMNLPTIAFVTSAITGIITTTLLLINFFK